MTGRFQKTALLLSMAAVLTLMAGSFHAFASTGNEETDFMDDDRMAGSSPVSEDEEPPPPPRPHAVHEGAEETTQQNQDLRPQDAPGTLHQDFKDIEPIGLIADGSGGGLGEDVWYGSDRDFITARMLETPSITHFPVVQDLLRRLYLTTAKPEYFNRNGNRPQPGRDMLTLRIKKLEEMGLYQEAIKLYSRIVDEPYHEELARAGVLSMMQGGKGSLGCLETRTVMNRFGELELWQTLNAVCDIALRRLANPEGILSGDRHTGLGVNDIDLSGSGSAILSQLSRKQSFVYHARSQADIASLSEVERSALQTSDAFVFDRFRFDPKSPVSPAAFGVILGARNISENMRFTVLAGSAAYGLKPLSSVQEQYNLFKNNTREKPTGWRQLATLYRLADTTDPGPAQNALLANALSLGRAYGGAYALSPFADMLIQADPGAFGPEDVKLAVRIMMAANKTVPASWLNRLSQGIGDRNSLLFFIAAEMNSDLSTDSKVNVASFRNLFEKLGIREKVLIAAIYEKLNRDSKLHNYIDTETYEKFLDLTGTEDYVMPSTDLTGRLTQAFKDRRLGESVLLSAIALQGAQPGSVNPGLMQEIIDGWKKVGLTKEARALATEAILGLSH